MQLSAAPAPIPISVVNENSKYAGSVAVKKAGPPPARKMAGAIDVIGGGNLSSRRPESGLSPSSPALEETPPIEVVLTLILLILKIYYFSLILTSLIFTYIFFNKKIVQLP